MAEFLAPPSWLTTARFLGHMVMPGRVTAKGFDPISARERAALEMPLTLVKCMAVVILTAFAVITGMIMANTFFGGLVFLVMTVVGGPLALVTTLWIGFKIILDEKK